MSKKHNINRRFFDNCKGKPKKFKDLKEEPSVAATEAPTATASITPIEPVHEDSAEELTRLVDEVIYEDNNTNIELGIASNSVGIT